MPNSKDGHDLGKKRGEKHSEEAKKAEEAWKEEVRVMNFQKELVS